VSPVTFRDPFLRTSPTPAVVAVIPARYQSTRLPGKPLAEIDGRPMIEHVWRRIATLGMRTIIATDDTRIANTVERFGGEVRMTGSDHRTGTDRIAEAVRELECDIVINVQGDLPLIEPAMVMELLRPLVADASVQMTTLCARAAPEEYANPNVVKVVVDRNGDALYFSRAAIPYVRSTGVVFKHIGLYGFRREFLLTFAELPQTPLEQAESLEQLRALEHGYRIRTIETRHSSIEVDTPEDLERVRRHERETAR
jgi:3-deoxy-manno-octulosonate cytidylyltransferase (CMP-KDO synthetase)